MNPRLVYPDPTPMRSREELEARLAEEDRAHDQTLKERDHAEGMADKLAAALATLLGVEIGEHSSGNCPWTAALEAFEDRRTADSAAEGPCPKCGTPRWPGVPCGRCALTVSEVPK